MDGSPWYVLHVLSNHEKRVAQHLSVRSIDHYLPLYSEKVRWSDRTVITERPLFGGYVFARFSARHRLDVVSTPGVLHLLGDRQKDLVTESEIERIREGLSKGLALRPHPNVDIGTHVRIRRGVFEGVEGRVLEFRQDCRVILSLAGIQRSFSIEVRLDEVERIGPAARSKPSPPLPAYGY